MIIGFILDVQYIQCISLIYNQYLNIIILFVFCIYLILLFEQYPLFTFYCFGGFLPASPISVPLPLVLAAAHGRDGEEEGT